MLSELLTAASLLVALALLAAEVRAWWRPSLQARFQRRLSERRPAGPVRRASPYLAYTLLSAAGAAGLFWWITTSVAFGAATGAAAYAVGANILPRWRRRSRGARARAELPSALRLLAVSLHSGQAVATALGNWPQDIARSMGTGQSVLLPEVERVKADMGRGDTPEGALTALADRLDLDEVRMLAVAVRLSRQRGADVGDVIARSADMLEGAAAVRAQVQRLTASKQVEALAIALLPVIMLALFMMVNPDYIAPLIQTAAGRVILGIALLLETAALLLGRWLTHIEV